MVGANVAIMMKDKQNAIRGDNHRDIGMSCIMHSLKKTRDILPVSCLKIKVCSIKKANYRIDSLPR
ncbi:hypothetical protein EXD91_10565 [Acinetobacter pittii]|uniref:Uncharacterized protein n=1 Tax=Acinetobacter pittii TaxID=48296 RepID=A0A1Y4YXJ7_ACIPI|nr:hypothetical protein C6N17_14805 [Acinetobacter pittii]OYP78641.1 hypothetical protein CIL08_03370 [Acinetobacter sp. BS1]TDM60841.1 hypothetical protein C5B72_17260 [Acinetobacter sp. KU 011TH]TDM61019.1 hypothetical protein C4608_17270 [Acinetobacter sp. KU 013TH]AVZ07058.1 hypothetical protein DBQ26_14975 [Acinetobacter pittii]